MRIHFLVTVGYATIIVMCGYFALTTKQEVIDIPSHVYETTETPRPNVLPTILLEQPLPLRSLPVASPRPRAAIKETYTLSEIGKDLFFDPILSANGEISCATCHLPEKTYASNGLPLGISKLKLSRRAPSIVNLSTAKKFFWDGRSSSLEQQTTFPITHPDEMGSKLTDVINKLNASELYRIKLGRAWTVADLSSSLAAFERTLIVTSPKLDAYRRGSADALTPSEARGYNLFRGEAQCYRCHTGENFTDESFHNTGVGVIRGDGGSTYTNDPGRYNVTGDRRDIGKFKTPGLHGCRLSGPYMHDASLTSLEDVVEWYRVGGVQNGNLDRFVAPLKLSEQGKRDLVAFLKVL